MGVADGALHRREPDAAAVGLLFITGLAAWINEKCPLRWLVTTPSQSSSDPAASGGSGLPVWPARRRCRTRRRLARPARPPRERRTVDVVDHDARALGCEQTKDVQAECRPAVESSHQTAS